MNLAIATDFYAGGPGSGCTGPNCGRPKSGLQGMLEDASKVWGENNLWSKLAKYGHAGNTEPFTDKEIQQLKSLTQRAGFRKQESCKVGFCFMNAQRLALAGLHDKDVQLVEGLVTVHGVPIDHSWIEYKGKVYDPTLATYKADEPGDYTKAGGSKLSKEGPPEYVGVAVPKDEIVKHQFKTETYDPLSHAWRDAKLQAKIWTEG